MSKSRSHRRRPNDAAQTTAFCLRMAALDVRVYLTTHPPAAGAIARAAAKRLLRGMRVATAPNATIADLVAVCRSADAYIHTFYPHMDAEQAALCATLVDAVSAALRPTATELPPAARQESAT